MDGIDVTVVLNMHREALLLAPTLHSLQSCAQEAEESGISVELVAVFDRADDATREVFRSVDLSAFCRIEEVEVSAGSLGLARNAGIACAQGEFIWTSDGDDLVSSNCIVALLDTARRHSHTKVAVFLEYLCAFGDKYFNCRYVGSEYLTAADFAFQHPYVSRIFVNRAVFDSIGYDDLRVTSGFAYEDWYLNCQLRAMGYDMAVAPDTVFFYRQRVGSLLRQADAASARLIPQSKLFDVGPFLYDMETCRERVGDWQQFMNRRHDIFRSDNTSSFKSSEKLLGYLGEAARLEPELEPHRVESAHSYCPLPWDPRHWGMAMESLYRMLGTNTFSDVVLLPWLKPGGAEKYILNILEEISAQQADARLLVVAGESTNRHEWVTKLPESAIFIDIYNAFPLLDDIARDAMLMRAMLAVSVDGARLHIKSSVFAHRLLDAYAAVLTSKFQTIYYRFCDDIYPWRHRSMRGPWGINVMRRHLPGFRKVVTDCVATVMDDQRVLGTLQSKYETIYTRCELTSRTNRKPGATHRLLWASRICPQKRPELLAGIAGALRDLGLDVVIDAYGTPDPGVDPFDIFGGRSAGIEYRGTFSAFQELPIESYDAFLYTSGYDGLPNILLEVLAAGLPVVAPDVGGIGEVVIPGVTGWLVESGDEHALVHGYARAISTLYEDRDRAESMAKNGRQLIASQHGESAFSARVGEVLGLYETTITAVG